MSSRTFFFKNCPTERKRGEKNCPTERNRDEKNCPTERNRDEKNRLQRGGGVAPISIIIRCQKIVLYNFKLSC